MKQDYSSCHSDIFLGELEMIETILLQILDVDDEIELDSLKDTPLFPQKKPLSSSKPSFPKQPEKKLMKLN